MGSETICSVFPRTCFFLSQNLTLLEVNTQLHRMREHATHTSPCSRHSRTTDSAHLGCISCWMENWGQEPLWDWRQVAATEQVEYFNPSFLFNHWSCSSSSKEYFKTAYFKVFIFNVFKVILQIPRALQRPNNVDAHKDDLIRRSWTVVCVQRNASVWLLRQSIV